MKLSFRIKDAISHERYDILLKLAQIEKDEINDSIDEDENNLLMWAIANRQYRLARTLFSNKKINVNYTNKLGQSALVILVDVINSLEDEALRERYNFLLRNQLTRNDINQQILNEVLKKENKLPNTGNDKDKDLLDGLLRKDGVSLQYDINKFILHDAVKYGKMEIVKLLIAQENIDMNMKDYQGLTPLMRTAELSDKKLAVELARTLLTRKDLKINAQNDNGRTSLMLAYRYGNMELVDLFLNRGDINVNLQDVEGGCLILDAANRGDYAFIDRLLSRGDININVVDEKGGNLLSILMSHFEYEVSGSREMILKLLTRKDIKLDDLMTKSILAIAVKENDVEIVKILLDKCKNIFPDGSLALINAINGMSNEEENAQEIFSLLIASDKIDFNAPATFEGEMVTPLEFALKVQNEEAINTLISNENVVVTTAAAQYIFAQKRFDLFGNLIRDNRYDLAKNYGNRSGLSHLLGFAKTEQEMKDAMAFAMYACDEKNVRTLFNAKDEKGHTALYQAINIQAKEPVKMFKVCLDAIVENFGFIELDFGKDFDVLKEPSFSKDKNAQTILGIVEDYKKKITFEEKEKNTAQAKVLEEDEPELEM